MEIERIEKWAALYNEAARSGEPPIAAAARQMGVSQSTATRRIAKARAAGLIDPPVPGRTLPGWSAKIVAVANELGVEPQALAEAVRNKAGGRLTA